MFARFCFLQFAAAFAVAPLAIQVVGQEPDAQNAPSVAWTVDEALENLKYHPRDVYLQYVALQLARQEGRSEEAAQGIRRRNPAFSRRAQRMDEVSLFSIFSGQLAVQESLQLDAMAPEVSQPGARPARRRSGPRPIPEERFNQDDDRPARPDPRDTVAIGQLQGPTIESHPWEEMLAGQNPPVSGLARRVPVDFFFVSFRSVNKLIDAADVGLKWGAHLVNQSSREARTQLVGERLQQQLAVRADDELRPFYDAVVEEVAIVGSDLFFRSGTDVTMLFLLKQPAVFRARMDTLLQGAEKARPDARRTKGKLLGVDYVKVETPDRHVRVYSAYPTPELHVRSNSEAGLEKVLAAILGKDAAGQPVERLGDTTEFRYVRTLMPEGADEEDGLIYLSDPFVRRLMSPELRLTERRRQVCYNHLRMIGHAALLHRTQTGRLAQSLGELTTAGHAPGEFGEGKFACPEQGAYELAADGLTGVCTHHGYASYLTPCLEKPVDQVSPAEAEAYRSFLANYNLFWRQFFDPIAIRLQITSERLRAETIVLPLIDNTLYTQLAATLGGEPEALDALPVPERNIFSFAVRIDKPQLLRQLGLEQFIQLEAPANEQQRLDADTQSAALAMRQLLLSLHMYADAMGAFPRPKAKGLSWRVHMLPYLEQQALYDAFRLDEPWDSEHNRQLIEKIPAVFRSRNAELTKAGKTRLVVPRGEQTLFPDTPPPGATRGRPVDAKRRPTGVQIRQITDGTSNTIALLEADDLHAVVWTKPDDIELEAENVRKLLTIRPPGAFLAGMADGSVNFIRQEAQPEALAGMITRNGSEVIPPDAVPLAPLRLRSQSPRSWRRQAEMLAELRIGELLTRGVGNQIGFHVYDSEPMFDLSLTRFMGRALSSFGGARLEREMLFLFPLIGALNGPVYVSIPVADRLVVDEFFERFDRFLVERAYRDQRGWFIRIEEDAYQLEQESTGEPIRAYSFGFGPVKWRFFWRRIGDAVYIASKSEVIDDLAAIASSEAGGSNRTADNLPSDVGHGFVRLRPRHWNQVLGAYQLGWEEARRKACLRNLGPLSGLSRAMAGSANLSLSPADLRPLERRVYDVHHFCPDAGHYHLTSDGRQVHCSVHGSAQKPKQTTAPAPGSDLAQLVQQLDDVTLTLTFLEDGLHAVATITAQPNHDELTTKDTKERR